MSKSNKKTKANMSDSMKNFVGEKPLSLNQTPNEENINSTGKMDSIDSKTDAKVDTKVDEGDVKSDAKGLYQNQRMVNGLLNLKGQSCNITTSDDKCFNGTFSAVNEDGDLAIVHANPIEDSTVVNYGDKKIYYQENDPTSKKMIFPLADYKCASFENVPIKEIMRAVSCNGDSGSTSHGATNHVEHHNGGNKEHVGKVLQPWDDSDTTGNEDFLTLEEENQSSTWDPEEMFSKNSELYGCKSTYDPKLKGYTTQLVEQDTEEYANRKQRAEEIAREIEKSSGYQRNIDREVSDKATEEEKFSSVAPADGQSRNSGGKWSDRYQKNSGDGRSYYSEGRSYDKGGSKYNSKSGGGGSDQRHYRSNNSSRYYTSPPPPVASGDNDNYHHHHHQQPSSSSPAAAPTSGGYKKLMSRNSSTSSTGGGGGKASPTTSSSSGYKDVTQPSAASATDTGSAAAPPPHFARDSNAASGSQQNNSSQSQKMQKGRQHLEELKKFGKDFTLGGKPDGSNKAHSNSAERKSSPSTSSKGEMMYGSQPTMNKRMGPRGGMGSHSMGGGKYQQGGDMMHQQQMHHPHHHMPPQHDPHQHHSHQQNIRYHGDINISLNPSAAATTGKPYRIPSRGGTFPMPPPQHLYNTGAIPASHLQHHPNMSPQQPGSRKQPDMKVVQQQQPKPQPAINVPSTTNVPMPPAKSSVNTFSAASAYAPSASAQVPAPSTMSGPPPPPTTSVPPPTIVKQPQTSSSPRTTSDAAAVYQSAPPATPPTTPTVAPPQRKEEVATTGGGDTKPAEQSPPPPQQPTSTPSSTAASTTTTSQLAPSTPTAAAAADSTNTNKIILNPNAAEFTPHSRTQQQQNPSTSTGGGNSSANVAANLAAAPNMQPPKQQPPKREAMTSQPQVAAHQAIVSPSPSDQQQQQPLMNFQTYPNMHVVPSPAAAPQFRAANPQNQQYMLPQAQPMQHNIIHPPFMQAVYPDPSRSQIAYPAEYSYGSAVLQHPQQPHPQQPNPQQSPQQPTYIQQRPPSVHNQNHIQHVQPVSQAAGIQVGQQQAMHAGNAGPPQSAPATFVSQQTFYNAAPVVQHLSPNGSSIMPQNQPPIYANPGPYVFLNRNPHTMGHNAAAANQPTAAHGPHHHHPHAAHHPAATGSAYIQASLNPAAPPQAQAGVQPALSQPQASPGQGGYMQPPQHQPQPGWNGPPNYSTSH